MQDIPEENVRVDPAPTVDAPTSFFMEVTHNESVRRTAWDNVWSSLGLIPSPYLPIVAALNAEQTTTFKYNLGTVLV